jgi:vacuolar-type H+-ATPase subunit D/Vma8
VTLRLVLPAMMMLLAAPAWAEEPADLEQTITDLNSQTGDKERIDTQGATKVEISQIRGWLTNATNSVKEKTAKVARRFFDLVRAQMKLVDQLISLSQIESEADRLEREVAKTKQRIGTMTGQLEEKRVQLRALKMREGGN